MSRFAESKYTEDRSDSCCSDDSFELLSSASNSPRTGPAVAAPGSPSSTFTRLSRDSSGSSNASSSFELVSASSPVAIPALHSDAWIAVVPQPSLLPAAPSTAAPASAPSSPCASPDASATDAWLAFLPDTDALRHELDEDDDRVFESYFLQVESDSEFRAGLRAMNQADAALCIKRRLRTTVRPELSATTLPAAHSRRMRGANRAAAQLIEDETDAPVPIASHHPLSKSLQRRARRAESLSPSEPTAARRRRREDRLRSVSLDDLRSELLEQRLFRVDWRSTCRDDTGYEWAAEDEEKEQARRLLRWQEFLQSDLNRQRDFNRVADAASAAAQAAQAPFCVLTPPLQRPKHWWSFSRPGFYSGYEQFRVDEQHLQEEDESWDRAQVEEERMNVSCNPKQKQRAAATGSKTRKEQKLRAETKRIELKQARSKPKQTCPALKERTPCPAVHAPEVTSNSRARRAAARQAASRSGSRFVSPAIAGPAVLALRTTKAQRSRTAPKQHVTVAQIVEQLRIAAASPAVTSQLFTESFRPPRVAASKPYTAPYINDNWRGRRMMSGFQHRFAHFNRHPFSLQPALDLPAFQTAFYELFRGVVETSLNSALYGTRITAVKLASVPSWAGKWMNGYGAGSFERRFFLELLRRVQCGSNQPGVAPTELSLRFVPVQGCRYARKRDLRRTFNCDGNNGFDTHDARACRLECQMGLSGFPFAANSVECYAPVNVKAMHQRHDPAVPPTVTVAPLVHPASLSFSPPPRSLLSTPAEKPVLAPLSTRSVMVCATFDSLQRCASSRDRVVDYAASILPCVEVEYELVAAEEPQSIKAMQRAIKRADATEPLSRPGLHRVRRSSSRARDLWRGLSRNVVQFGASTGADRRAAAAWQDREEALADWNAEGDMFWREALENIWREMKKRERQEDAAAAAAAGEKAAAAVASDDESDSDDSDLPRPPRVLFRLDGKAIADLPRHSRQISLS